MPDDTFLTASEDCNCGAEIRADGDAATVAIALAGFRKAHESCRPMVFTGGYARTEIDTADWPLGWLDPNPARSDPSYGV